MLKNNCLECLVPGLAHKLMQLWSKHSQAPSQAAELGSIVRMIQILQAAKVKDWRGQEVLHHDSRRLLKLARQGGSKRLLYEAVKVKLHCNGVARMLPIITIILTNIK